MVDNEQPYNKFDSVETTYLHALCSSNLAIWLVIIGLAQKYGCIDTIGTFAKVYAGNSRSKKC